MIFTAEETEQQTAINSKPILQRGFLTSNKREKKLPISNIDLLFFFLNSGIYTAEKSKVVRTQMPNLGSLDKGDEIQSNIFGKRDTKSCYCSQSESTQKELFRTISRTSSRTRTGQEKKNNSR